MKRVFSDPEALRRLTGFTPAEFERLADAFTQLWVAEHGDHTVLGRQRQCLRRAGFKGGFNNTSAMLFFVLFYYRWYPTQKTIGLLFGMTQQWASLWIHHLTPIAAEALQQPLRPPRRKPLGLPDLLRHEPTMISLVDPAEVMGPRRLPERGVGASLAGLW